jgi:hypothetical protein
MKIRFVSGLTIFTLLVISVNQCFAADERRVNIEEDIKLQVSKALSGKRKVQVNLRNGTTVKGEVTEVLQGDFYIEQKTMPRMICIKYEDVAAVHVQNQFLKTIKRVGKTAAKIGFNAVGVPVVIVLSISDWLLKTHILPSC